ncbi:MAG: cyclic nucleotide-binding domain-containing protein [Thermoleophilia bacterium]|nr:cyclic nucleotide-binding domain-containing protein [Thermoleophilia bacterium]
MRLFREDTKIEALRRAPLFEGLSRNELEQLARLAEDLEVDAGKVLTREGESGREFFVILEGEVDVSRRGQTIATRGAGDFIGEIAILEDIQRTATVTAKTPLRFFVLTAQAFRSVVDEYPEVERKVLRTLARRLAALSDDPSMA